MAWHPAGAAVHAPHPRILTGHPFLCCPAPTQLTFPVTLNTPPTDTTTITSIALLTVPAADNTTVTDKVRL